MEVVFSDDICSDKEIKISTISLTKRSMEQLTAAKHHTETASCLYMDPAQGKITTFGDAMCHTEIPVHKKKKYRNTLNFPSYTIYSIYNLHCFITRIPWKEYWKFTCFTIVVGRIWFSYDIIFPSPCAKSVLKKTETTLSNETPGTETGNIW